MATAAQQQRQVQIRYRSGGERETEREIDPYGVVFNGGHWYTMGHCHLRGDVRIFRLDRMTAAVLLPDSFVRPSGFDSRAHLLETIARIADVWDVSVLLDLKLAEAQRLVPAGLALLEPAEPYVRLRASIDDLDMIARMLASLGCALIVERPEQLREALRALSDQLRRAADARHP
jgi:predicted DNA-binding transcriptional regulator YafY